jgi:hypothetical protein
MICPVCKNDTLIEGDRVDVGFGEHMGMKCGPDHCETCGFVEQGPDPLDPPIEHFIHCWNNHIDPWPKPPDMISNVPLSPDHAEWIKTNVLKDGYGECREVCAKMIAAFPGLRRVYGTYSCLIWGMRYHFWCINDQNHVIDPTAAQFPSKGKGVYSMLKLYDVAIDTMNSTSI